MTTHDSRSLLRQRGSSSGRVGFAELFFDLVFVFAITQLSHSLVAHFTVLGVLETLLLTLSVWWVWIYTSWAMNWLDPEKTPVRIMLFAMMLAGLVLAAALPKAFESTGLVFALAHAGMQVGRSLFTAWCFRIDHPRHFTNFLRISFWLALAGVFWIAGGLAAGPWRLGLWAIALGIEYMAPWALFWTPGLGRSTTNDWDVDGHHMAERCGLFIIIALGESILVTGATFAKAEWTLPVTVAFVAFFLASVAMWWIYFSIGAERGTHFIAASKDPGSVARLAYTYLHIPIVGGIIVLAASDEFVLAHPGGHADMKTVIATLAGVGLFLIGNLLFKRATAGWYQLSHLVGLGLVVAAIPVAGHLSPATLACLAAGILVTVAIWETRSLKPRG